MVLAMHACKDYSGAEIMRVLRDEVWNRQIPIADFTAAVELIKDDKGQVAGVVLQNMETGEYKVARAKTVIIATGGAGRHALPALLALPDNGSRRHIPGLQRMHKRLALARLWEVFMEEIV